MQAGLSEANPIISTFEMMKKILASFLIGLMSLLAPSAQASFGDLPEYSTYSPAINYLKDRGILEGYEDNTVRPNSRINRAELVKLVVEDLDLPPASTPYGCFSDVKDEWFAPAICSAKEQGIVQGLPNGSFEPGRHVNRVEALKIILEATGLELITRRNIQEIYPDVPADSWFAAYVSTAKQGNYLSLYSGFLHPGDPVTRGEISDILYRILITQDQNATSFKSSFGAGVISLPANADPVLKGGISEALYQELQLYALDHINQLRAENGKGPLRLNPLLNDIAFAHSQDMALHIREMSHGGSVGETAHDRIKRGQVPNQTGTALITISHPENIGWSGENIGKNNRGQASTESLRQAILSIHAFFMAEAPDEPNHRTTMLSTLYPFSEIGIGLYLDDDQNLWITEDFISIQGESL
ncbi:MAG: S-layer homology domain-containing protein [bacterium]|nr:S-layer homology domain-containing protein [bacterium]